VSASTAPRAAAIVTVAARLPSGLPVASTPLGGTGDWGRPWFCGAVPRRRMCSPVACCWGRRR